MGRLNERNCGSVTHHGEPKKKRMLKPHQEEVELLKALLKKVYDALEFDETTGTYVDGGRITVSLSDYQHSDLFDLIHNRRFTTGA